ncbi:hypothetical protein CYMTET_53121, partial [Cymbomonas tetramitiformis]
MILPVKAVAARATKLPSQVVGVGARNTLRASYSVKSACLLKKTSAPNSTLRNLSASRRGSLLESARTPPKASPGRFFVAGAAAPMKVLVTGAGGRTGGLVYQQLLQRPEDFTPVGLVRSEKSAKKLGSDVKYVIGDIMDPASLETAVAGCDALVLLTSAAPQIKPLSLVKSIITKILPGVEAVRPEFDYPEGGSPEEVDWTGAKNQIDAAVKAGVKRIVFVGSMGGDPCSCNSALRSGAGLEVTPAAATLRSGLVQA